MSATDAASPEGARQKNQEAVEKIDTTSLAGGVLPRDLFDEWFQEVQDEAVLLNRVRTVSMPREKMRVPKIGVGERLWRPQTEGSSVAETDVTTNSIDLDAVKGSVNWTLTSEAVEDTPQGTANVVFNQMTQQWAVDAEDRGVNGDESGSGAFITANDGWLAIATARGSPIYNHDDLGDGTGAAQPIDTSVFHNMIQAVDSKYLRANPVFILNTKQVQEYANNLTNRSDGLGATVLMGDSDLTPFSYDIIGTAMMPEGEAMFTPPQNLLYGVYREVEVDVLEQSDDIHANDLAGKWALRARDDFQVEDENALVRAAGIQASGA